MGSCLRVVLLNESWISGCVWVEGGICGFSLVWDEVVGMEVLDETGEIRLCMLL